MKTENFPNLKKGIVKDTFRAPPRQVKNLLSTYYMIDSRQKDEQ